MKPQCRPCPPSGPPIKRFRRALPRSLEVSGPAGDNRRRAPVREERRSLPCRWNGPSSCPARVRARPDRRLLGYPERRCHGREKGTSLISPVCEGKEPREHARKRLMQAACGVKQGLFSDVPSSFPVPFSPPPCCSVHAETRCDSVTNSYPCSHSLGMSPSMARTV